MLVGIFSISNLMLTDLHDFDKDLVDNLFKNVKISDLWVRFISNLKFIKNVLILHPWSYSLIPKN